MSKVCDYCGVQIALPGGSVCEYCDKKLLHLAEVSDLQLKDPDTTTKVNDKAQPGEESCQTIS